MDSFPPPPPEDEDDRFNRITKSLRRTRFLNDAIDAAAADVKLALSADRDQYRSLLATLHHHIGLAWDDGAGYLADLISSIDTLRVQNRKLKEQLMEALRRLRE